AAAAASPAAVHVIHPGTARPAVAVPRGFFAASLSLTLPATLVLAFVVLFIPRVLFPTRVWESRLQRAAGLVEPIATFNSRFAQLARATDPAAQREGLADLAAEMSRAMNQPVAVTPQAVSEAIRTLHLTLARESIEWLEEADKARPDDWRARREASRVWLLLAAIARDQGDADSARGAADEGLAIAVPSPLPPRGLTASQHAWIALVHETRASLLNDDSELAGAMSSLQSAATLDPFNVDHAHRLFKWAMQLLRADEARTWAAKTIELNTLTRLDPEVKSLSQQELQRIRSYLDTSKP
ncbi:MAG: hypothetical protein H7Y88_09065, partial [Phycisphaerales bacterium]|nr:hypothetical protein [Phycisphaerales bacterium]